MNTYHSQTLLQREDFFNSFNRDAIKPPELGEQPSFDPAPGRERGWELLAVLRLKGAELEQPLGWPWV